MPQLVCALVLSGMDTNAQDFFGSTPLHWAAGRGHAEVVNMLVLVAESAPGIADSAGQTPLLAAAARGHWSVVQSLLDAGVGKGFMDINACDEQGRAAVHYAAMAGDVDTLEMLLEVPGAEVDSPDAGGWTPVMYATKSGDQEAVDLLCARSSCGLQRVEDVQMAGAKRLMQLSGVSAGEVMDEVQEGRGGLAAVGA